MRVVCRVSCLCEVLRVERLWIVTDGRDTAPRKETTDNTARQRQPDKGRQLGERDTYETRTRWR